MGTAPPVLEVRRDRVGREIRLELAEWRSRTGGVYALTGDEQRQLHLPGHLPGWGDFLPDFVIVYATGAPVTVPGIGGELVESVRWDDLRVHVGGATVSSLGRAAGARQPRDSAAAEWRSVVALLGNVPLTAAAPEWLLDLIRDHTPWGFLLSSADARLA